MQNSPEGIWKGYKVEVIEAEGASGMDFHPLGSGILSLEVHSKLPKISYN
jgi:hypothetical protein